jgi:hypothetical protein
MVMMKGPVALWQTSLIHIDPVVLENRLVRRLGQEGTDPPPERCDDGEQAATGKRRAILQPRS